MRRGLLLRWLLVALVAVAALVVSARREAGPATNAERVQALAENLRCPTCSGQSVADSDAPASRAIRGEIDRQVADGRTDSEIRGFLTDRYGAQILLTPPRRGLSVTVWIVPPVAIGAAFLGLVVALRRRGRGAEGPPSNEDRERVADALAKR